MVDHAKNAGIMAALRARHVAAPREAEFASHLDRLLCRDKPET